MNDYGLAFLSVNLVLLMVLPRRWAPLPLLVGACYIVREQSVEVGPFHFTLLRLLLAGGMLRVVMRREWPTGGINSMDWWMLVWAGWALTSSFFYKNPSAEFVFRLGLIYDAFGIYFLIRIFCQSFEDVELLSRMIVILLMPVAAEMIYEKLTAHNLFNLLGGGWQDSSIRDGKIRARGPFAHAILAGTIGAVNLPMICSLWQNHRKLALVGFFVCFTMIYTSASSGPILSGMAGVGALFMWHYRDRMKWIRWLAVFCYIFLDFVMIDPAYFLLARIDLTGSSTGWHRAELIRSAGSNLSEWWVAGTDYTRHWMPYGVSWSPDHSDITNHYLQMGVIGGLPLMFLFIAILFTGFSLVGKTLQQFPELPKNHLFMMWSLGACLFAHAMTFVSVSYFDQSFVFIYLILAIIVSAWSSIGTAPVPVIEADSIEGNRPASFAEWFRQDGISRD